MKLEIEDWVNNKHYSLNVRKLFSESVTCYRNGAYRASLIFSYIGFLTIIKEVLIKSQKPGEFTDNEWENLLQKINLDEQWEKEVYESLLRVKKVVFPINEDLKLQLRYWKDRRNDCAHFKNNEIESHHTEAFWSFIKSNVPKMTVEGGKETLLNKFSLHFDETFTPPNKDFSHLIHEISTCVLSLELEDFFRKLKKRVDYRRGWYIDSPIIDIFSKILDVGEPQIQFSILDFLRKENRDIYFLSAHPSKINRFNLSETEIRNLWKQRLSNKTFGINPFRIYTALLKENLIPKKEIEEANECVFDCYSQTDYRFIPEKNEVDILKSNKFFEKIFEIAIVKRDLDRFMWVNSKCDILVFFIENVELQVETVDCICRMYQKRNPSEWLLNALEDSFSNNSEKQAEFIKLAKKQNCKIPKIFL